MGPRLSYLQIALLENSMKIRLGLSNVGFLSFWFQIFPLSPWGPLRFDTTIASSAQVRLNCQKILTEESCALVIRIQ